MVPTREHLLIQKWANDNGAVPAQVRRHKFDGEPAILTFLFGEIDEYITEIYVISWEMFFAQFDLMGLSMAWDECTPQFSIVKVEGRSAAYPSN